jgi:membrane-bound lytic murein transglycosylase D
MKLAAELAGISEEDLYELNPAFQRWATDPAGPHFLLLPPESVALFRQNNAELTPAERMPVTRYRVAPETQSHRWRASSTPASTSSAC